MAWTGVRRVTAGRRAAGGRQNSYNSQTGNSSVRARLSVSLECF
jgi:hypothetical protein